MYRRFDSTLLFSVDDLISAAEACELMGQHKAAQKPAKQPKRRIRENIWGNWKGYEGTRQVKDFGTDRRDAELWLADPAAYAAQYAYLDEPSFTFKIRGTDARSAQN